MHRKLVFIFNMFDDLVDPGIGKLLHFTTFLTNQMFVVTVVKSFLKLGDIIPELMFESPTYNPKATLWYCIK